MDANPIDDTFAPANADHTVDALDPNLLSALAETNWQAGQSVVAALGETVALTEAIDLTARPETADQRLPAGLRYREMGRIGQGGLGVVVEAYDSDLRRRVALKRPRRDRLSAKSIASLIEEAQITAQLEHPNIPPVHDLGLGDDGRPFFSMTRLRGRTLSELLAERARNPEIRAQYPRARLLRIFVQVAYAVAFAHSRGVIHRDLKPENIMVGEFGEVRLMDWGIARVMSRSGRAGESGFAQLAEGNDDDPVTLAQGGRPRTRVGAFVGTPGYAAPEQIEGVEDIDHRADIYALGVVLYEMLSGRLPVDGETVGQVMLQTCAGDITPLESVASVQRGMSKIVGKALAKEPANRYGEVTNLIDDLDALAGGRKLEQVDESRLDFIHRWYSSRPPMLRRMKSIDMDMVMFSCGFLGAAIALLLEPYLGNVLLIPSMVLTVALGAIVFWRVLRPDADAHVEHVLAPDSRSWSKRSEE